MGIFSVPVSIGHPDGGDLFPVVAVVDTGALHSVMPQSLLEGLSIAPLQTGRYRIADGNEVEYGVADARFSIGERTRYCPVIFGPEERCLIGATTLNIFELVIDSTGERLAPATNLTL